MPISLIRIALVSVLFSGGCAAMMKESPGSDWRPSQSPSCSEGRGGVFLDGVLATGWAVGSISALSEEESGLAIGLLAVAGLHVVSAISGHRSADRCRRARAEHGEWLEAARRDDLEAAEREAVADAEPAASAPVSDKAAPRPAEPVAEPTAPQPVPPTRAELPPKTESPAAGAPVPSLAPRDRGDPFRDFWREVEP